MEAASTFSLQYAIRDPIIFRSDRKGHGSPLFCDLIHVWLEPVVSYTGDNLDSKRVQRPYPNHTLQSAISHYLENSTLFEHSPCFLNRSLVRHLGTSVSITQVRGEEFEEAMHTAPLDSFPCPTQMSYAHRFVAI